MSHLNPPNVKAFQISLRTRSGLHHELYRFTAKIDKFWHQVGVRPPLDLPPTLTLGQKWFTAFDQMPEPMKIMYIDANLSFDVFSPLVAQETDYMHKAAIAVNIAIEMLRDGE